MVHTIYKTTNLVNGKFYFGVHKTTDPNDEYLGSGTLIRRAIVKYGESSFKKEILFEYDNAEDAFKKEEELVEQHRGHPMCYNLRKGGAGGFDYMNRNGFSALGGSRSWPTKNRKRQEDPEYFKKVQEAARRNIKIAAMHVKPESRLKNLSKGRDAWRGQHHSEEYRSRKRIEVTGDKNPRYGQIWVNLGGLEKVISPDELDSHIAEDWMRGRCKRYWVETFYEIAKPRPIRLGKKTVVRVRKSRSKPRSEWSRNDLVDWPEDAELIASVAQIGQRALARKMGISNVAVHHRLKKIGHI